MELTTAERHGVRIMADIAKSDKEFVSIAEIAENQNISPKYAEKIVAGLKKAKLLQSTRGINGGYKLQRSANEISMKDILRASGDKLEIVECLTKECPHEKKCETREIWQSLNSLINDYLASITLQDLIDKTKNI